MNKLDYELWFCPDCLMAAVNDDYSGLDYYYDEHDSVKKKADIEAGLNALSKIGNIVSDFDSETGEGHDEFSNCGCDCYGSSLAGEFHRFALLGRTANAELNQ